MMGMHGEAWVNEAIQDADLLIALGMRFDDRVTGKLAAYAPRAKKIHVDIDATEINKLVRADVGIVGDLRAVMQALLPHVCATTRHAWITRIGSFAGGPTVRDLAGIDDPGPLQAAQVIHDIWKATGGRAIVVTDVGQHQMWAAQYYPVSEPHTWITSGGLGTMGFALPAAIGAKLARPDSEVWAIVGDGGFQMTLYELATACLHKLPVKVFVLNNHYLGMVRQWQEMFYEDRESGVDLEGNPDFAKLAECYEGAKGLNLKRPADVRKIIKRALDYNDGPCVINCEVEKSTNVYPMIPAGKALEDMLIDAPKHKLEKPTGST
jgi:acetolactate synthase-1/2/3 large subunit